MKMRKQRLMGLAMLAITALILVMARGGRTPEDSDATAAFLTGPLGLYMPPLEDLHPIRRRGAGGGRAEGKRRGGSSPGT